MSGYFARAAQRSGLVAQAPRPTPASAGDIVEQVVETSATPSDVAAVAMSETSSAKQATSAPSFAVSNTQALSQPNTHDTGDILSEQHTSVDSVASFSSPLRATPASFRPLSTETRDLSVDDFSVPSMLPSIETAPESFARETQSASSNNVIASTAAALDEDPSDIFVASHRSTGQTSLGETSSVASSALVDSSSEVLWSPSSEFRATGRMPSPTRADNDAPVFDSPLASPGANTSRSTQTSAREVHVRIGSVRVEVQSPAPRPHPAPAPVASAPALESPRFTPRRHYLRG